MTHLQALLPDKYTTASEDELATWIAEAKTILGKDLIILCHHYQREEVYRWADATGDSFKLARHAANHPEARFIVFCGVHFMAESADILTSDSQRVILPDLNAGCSMADMAETAQVVDAWDDIDAVCGTDGVIPITYMNSSAALKAFVGERRGAVCTSSNASAVLKWAFTDQKARKILFFPDEHLGRNTAVALGYRLDDCVIWDPEKDYGGLQEREIKDATLVLWRGHCSVHQRFTVAQINQARTQDPNVQIIVHPECAHDVVKIADHVGSTEVIRKMVTNAPAGTSWAIGTEINMVQRLASDNPDKNICSLDPLVCPCATMFRIDAPHLAWALTNLAQGNVVNQIEVEGHTARWARVALERMLAIV